jgi:hypothetical protein
VVAVAGAEREPLDRLPATVRPQRGDRGRVQLDPAPASSRLGSPHGEVLAVQVHVGPGERDQLAEPHPSRRGELVERRKPVGSRPGEEGAELGGRPDCRRPPSRLRRVYQGRRIAAEQVPPHRVG